MSLKKFLLKNQGTRQTVVKNTFWLSVGEIGSRLFRAAIVIYAARALGSAGYGVFSYVVSLAAFFTIFADIGISQILTRQISQKPQDEDSYFATSFWMKVGLLAVNALIVIFVAPIFAKVEAAKPLIPLAAILITFDNIRNFLAAYFRGKEKMEMEALLTISTNVAIALFGFVILTLNATPAALTWTYVLSAGVGALLGVILLRNKFKGLFQKFKRDLVGPIFSSSWPIAVMGAFGAFMLNIDILLIGYFQTSSEVGLYSAGQRVVQVLYVLPAIIAGALFPVFSRFVEKHKTGELQKGLERGLKAILLLSAPLALGGLVLGKEIILLLYGTEYLPAVLAFQLLILTPLLVFPGMVLSNFILAYDKHKKLVPLIIAASIINVVLDALLIPVWVIEGVAVATIVVSIIYNGGAWLIAKRINYFKMLDKTAKIGLATLLMAVFAFWAGAVGVHVIINILLSSVLYFALLYTFQEDTLVDIRQIILSK